MYRSYHKNAKISRKQFLKLGTAGICSLCLAGVMPAWGKLSAQTAPPSGPEAGARMGLIKTKQSPWFTNLEQNIIRCELCPHQCELDKGQRSLCRVRENRDGQGFTLVYGNPALIQEDPVERKPYMHVLPGSRALSVSTAGCNLECKFCEVWDMALVDPEEVYAHDLPPEDVIRHGQSAGLRSISFAFGEPVIFYEYMREVAEKARKEGFLTLVHTAGYIRPQPLKELCGVMDAANVDLKSFDPEFYREVVGGELEPVLKNLKTIKAQGIHLEITNIVIPTLNDDPEGIREMCKWIQDELGPDVPLHFARFYPLYQLSGLPRTPVSTLDQARDIAMEAGLNFVYVSRVTGHEGENTFCPDCGGKIIDRTGFMIDEINMENGNCAYCGREIPGIWS